jgi:DNA-directed RNA polymerase specialized sigma24 family protein
MQRAAQPGEPAEVEISPLLRARKVQVVEMRFFGGLSVEETAEVLKVSSVTVMREWSTAKAWLYRELAGETTDGA